jgi:glycosyltransferase involved in cell wall biosynthesis
MKGGTLRVLQVAYPFAPVGPDAVGGAEQVLSALDRGLVAAGRRSIVLAAEGSEVAGLHIAIPRIAGRIGPAEIATTHAALRKALATAVVHHAPHLLHFHGVDVLDYLPPSGSPALITLHLPPTWYPRDLWRLARPDTWLHAVSASQHAACPPCPNLLPPVANGIDLEGIPARIGKRDFALCLGRICPEKNQHQAMDAGSRAGLPVLLGGQVFGHAAHEAYWHDRVVPRLMAGPHRFLGAVGLARKRRLLSAARCLVSPSLAPETSSLVAMEALACGTPVVAFPSGAQPEIVEHGVTGFLVGDVAEMAEAMRAAGRLDPEACRAAAQARFSGDAMVARYLAAYAALARREVAHGAAL